MSEFSVVGMTTTPRHEVLPEAPAPAPTALPWRHLAVLSFAAFWTVTLEMLPAGLLPQISRDLDVRPARVGLLVTVWAVTVGLSSLPLTRLTRSWQRPTALAAGLAVLGVASLASALAPTFGGVLAARLVAATGHGLFWSVLMVYAASLAPAGREARAISVVLAGPVLAGVAGSADRDAARRTTRLALGGRVGGGRPGRRRGPGVDAACPRAPLHGRDPSRASRAGGPGPRRVGGPGVAHRAARRARPRCALRRLHLHRAARGRPVVGRRPRRGGPAARLRDRRRGRASGCRTRRRPGAPERVLAVAVASIALTFWLLAVTTDTVAVLAAVVVWGLLIGALPPALQSAVIGAASPAYRNTAGAVLVAVFNLGIAFGSAAGGVVIEEVGLGALLPLAAAVATVSAVGLAASSRRSAGESLSPPARP